MIQPRVYALQVGDSSPQIIGRDIQGGLFALTRLENKPKVINFFWVDCKPCRKELPLLSKKEQQYSKVIFVAIHAELNFKTDTNYDVRDIKVFSETLKSHPKKMVLGSDRLKKQYSLQGFPATILLSANNTVEEILYGFNNKTIKQLDSWLKKQN
ncbi:MAG: TlpA disulfide reductase family protein [Colwellia sp.]|jgi:AhpC/TSA family.